MHDKLDKLIDNIMEKILDYFRLKPEDMKIADFKTYCKNREKQKNSNSFNS